MGFGDVATHLIFFIAAIILASSASAIMFTTVQKVTLEANEQGDVIKKIVGTDFEVINDPASVVYNSTINAYIIYLKNTGSEDMYVTSSTLTVLLNGVSVNFQSDKISLKPGETATLYVYSSRINGTAKLSIINEIGIKKTFEFQG